MKQHFDQSLDGAKSNKPKVSVLLPVYNGAKFLGECLDSILVQDFADVEILISDNNSSDNTSLIIESYAARDSRIRWWRNPTNLGVTGNLNLLLQQARGEYIKYVFHDDKLLSSSAVRCMTEALENDPSVSLVLCATQFIDVQSRPLKIRNSFLRSGLLDGKSVIVKCFEDRGNPIGEPTMVMFRKKQAMRGFNERFLYLTDLEMWFYLLEQGNLAYLAEPLCAFRKHPEQISVACRQVNIFKLEYPQLLLDYAARPWLRTIESKRALFTNIYYLRKWHNKSGSSLIKTLLKIIRIHWYIVYWLRHKLTRPFRQLIAWSKRWI